MYKQISELSKWCQIYRKESKEIKPKNDSVFDTVLHIRKVQYYMNMVIWELIERSRTHDQSKLESPEKETFDKYSNLLHDSIYGSDEYKQFLKEMKPALDHHYKNNCHHPEFSKDGINGMTLIDLLEMLVDWVAASKRHATGDIKKSLEINQKRFVYTDELKKIFLNTIKLFED